jgi:hypothetical protein
VNGGGGEGGELQVSERRESHAKVAKEEKNTKILKNEFKIISLKESNFEFYFFGFLSRSSRYFRVFRAPEVRFRP